MKSYIKLTIFILVALAVAGAGLYYLYHKSPEASNTTVYRGKIAELSSVAQLCTVDFYEDYPIRGTVGRKHIFARMTMTGSISFDIDSLDVAVDGDTVKVTLPPETVVVRESTDPGAYRVIDTWNDAFLGSSTFTTDEENAVKRAAVDRFRRHIYAKGYVRRARAEAVENLTNLLTAFYDRPVIVTDPTPDGKVW